MQIVPRALARLAPKQTETVFVMLLTVPILLLGMSPLIGKLSLAAQRVARDTINAPVADQSDASTSTTPGR